MGLQAIRVEAPQNLRTALVEGFGHNGPVLIDADPWIHGTSLSTSTRAGSRRPAAPTGATVDDCARGTPYGGDGAGAFLACRQGAHGRRR